MKFATLGKIVLLTIFSLGIGAGSMRAEPAKVRVAYINNIQSAALLQMKTLAKEKDLDIDFIPFTRYPDVQRALAVNSVDIGPIAPMVYPPQLPKAIATSSP